LYDVNFFQTAYGTNNNFNTGNDIYSTATLINGGNARQAIWDAGGIDTISAVGSTIDDVVIDLRPGAFSSIGNLNSNISIAFRAQIENAVGSDGDDDLRGNELNNRISGGNGNDTIRGFGGNDTLLGGAGGDLYVFSVADGDNRVNEEKLAGRDTIQFLEFPSFNDFTEDFTFRLDGRDLVIQLTLNNGPADTVVTITDQTRGASRLESLVFGTSTIDLVNLTDQATGANQKFQITPESTIFGNLVTPV
jgi:Ca2+-binding RTX toxin-like protein